MDRPAGSLAWHADPEVNLIAQNSGSSHDQLVQGIAGQHLQSLPRLIEDKIYLVKNGGIASCLDAQTGGVF
jgi:hypothetical protein